MRIKSQLYVHYEDGRYEKINLHTIKNLRYEDAAIKLKEILGG